MAGHQRDTCATPRPRPWSGHPAGSDCNDHQCLDNHLDGFTLCDDQRLLDLVNHPPARCDKRGCPGSLQAAAVTKGYALNAAIHLQCSTCAASGGSWVAQQPLRAAPPASPRMTPRRAAKAPATGNATATPAAPAAADGTGTADGRAAMASSFVLGGSSTQQESLEPISCHEAETQRRGGRVNAMLNNAAVSTASVSVASLKEVMSAIGWYVHPYATLRYAILRYAVLRHAVLILRFSFCATLFHATLFYAYATLFYAYATLSYATLFYASVQCCRVFCCRCRCLAPVRACTRVLLSCLLLSFAPGIPLIRNLTCSNVWHRWLPGCCRSMPSNIANAQLFLRAQVGTASEYLKDAFAESHQKHGGELKVRRTRRHAHLVFFNTTNLSTKSTPQPRLCVRRLSMINCTVLCA